MKHGEVKSGDRGHNTGRVHESRNDQKVPSQIRHECPVNRLTRRNVHTFVTQGFIETKTLNPDSDIPFQLSRGTRVQELFTRLTRVPPAGCAPRAHRLPQPDGRALDGNGLCSHSPAPVTGPHLTLYLCCDNLIRMQIGMRHFSAETMAWLVGAAEAGLGRYQLARDLCAREGWVNDAGQPCVTSARLALPEIARRSGFRLAKGTSPPCVGTVADGGCPDVAFAGDLRDLGGVHVELETTRTGRRALRAMLAAHHPRGAPRHPGATLCYWIHSPRLGRIGGLTFHPASWHQAARDGYVGWSPRARVANLRLVVNNSRFLLLPGVRVPNLASHVLGRATARLADDWAAAHGVRPVLAYSYVNAAQRGSCYAAAGWETAGHASGVFAGRAAGPAVWMRPLAPNWRPRLCQIPDADPRWMTVPPPARAADAAKDGDWQALEFGRLSHPDGRIRKRIQAMAAHWETRPGDPVAVVFPGRKEQKAAYRLLSNPGVTMDDILESHRAATLQRCRDESVVLAIQDTTMLDYSPLQDVTGGLARLGGGGAGSHGIPAHVTLALSTSGRMLGLLDINADFRDGVTGETDGPCRTGDPQTDAGSAPPPESHDAGTESQRWVDSLELVQRCGHHSPGTRIIAVCDREGDLWAMFRAQARNPEAAGILVRCHAGRQRQVIVDGETRALRDHLAARPAIGARTVRVRARGGIKASRGRKAIRARPARTATVAMRMARVALKAPGGRTETLNLTAVLATETSKPPTRKQAINWLLLTSEGANPDDAGTLIDQYAARWAIEEYFKTLKQHTRIEDRRLNAADDLRRCLAFDAIMAWRVFDIQRAARAEPDRPALDFFDEDELIALYSDMKHRYKFTDTRAPPFDDLTMRQAAIDVGRYVGFIPSRRQPLPGTEKIRKGMKYMLITAAAYRSFKRQQSMTVSTMD